MSARTLTIPPFELPDGSNPTLRLEIALVDENNRRIQGLLTADGQPIVDRVDLEVSDTQATVDLHPQPEIEAVLNYGSTADQSSSYYLVSLENRATRYRHVFRTQIASGGALTWAEFAAGQGPLTGGQVSVWLTHPDDASVHVPGDATSGQMAVMGAGGNWQAIDPPAGTGDMQSVIYDPSGVADNTFDLGNMVGNLDGGVFT